MGNQVVMARHRSSDEAMAIGAYDAFYANFGGLDEEGRLVGLKGYSTLAGGLVTHRDSTGDRSMHIVALEGVNSLLGTERPIGYHLYRYAAAQFIVATISAGGVTRWRPQSVSGSHAGHPDGIMQAFQGPNELLSFRLHHPEDDSVHAELNIIRGGYGSTMKLPDGETVWVLPESISLPERWQTVINERQALGAAALQA